jgi:ectoine hydroxylase-related dioxygenase (phytanoyl-CoA dioxygenase family)
MLVTDELCEQYRSDGVVCVRQAFDHHWLELVSRSIERGRANPGPMYLDYSANTKPGTYCTDMWIWRDNPEMKRFIFESPAAALAGALMEVDSVMLVTDNWLVREAGSVNRAPWHHDDPYFDVGGKWCVLWMGLEPVGPGEGVVFLRGSHKWNRHFMPLSFAGTGPKSELVPSYEPTPDFSAELDRYDVLEFALEPGDCLVFDSFTVHGAPNPAPPARTVRRLTMRFADGCSTFEKRGPWTDQQCEYLQRFGHKPGERLVGELLPMLWQRSPSADLD